MTPIVLAPLAVLLVLAAAVGFLPSANAAASDADEGQAGGDGNVNGMDTGAGGPGTGGGLLGGVGAAAAQGLGAALGQAGSLDKDRENALRASREEYQRQAKAVAGLMRTLRGAINTATGKPAGTQKAGAWLAQVMADQGYSAQDRRDLFRDLDLRRKRKDGVWVWRDFPWRKTWEAADRATRRTNTKIQNNKSRNAPGISPAHQEARVFGDRASGPLAGAYAAAERAWLDHQSLITSGAT